MKVIVYSQPAWMFCKETREILSQKGDQFKDRNITKDPAAFDELRLCERSTEARQC